MCTNVFVCIAPISVFVQTECADVSEEKVEGTSGGGRLVGQFSIGYLGGKAGRRLPLHLASLL